MRFVRIGTTVEFLPSILGFCRASEYSFPRGHRVEDGTFGDIFNIGCSNITQNRSRTPKEGVPTQYVPIPRWTMETLYRMTDLISKMVRSFL